jgi:uncharacterized protein with PIN domain
VKNITVTVGDEMYAQARRLAAARNASVSGTALLFKGNDFAQTDVQIARLQKKQ